MLVEGPLVEGPLVEGLVFLDPESVLANFYRIKLKWTHELLNYPLIFESISRIDRV